MIPTEKKVYELKIDPEFQSLLPPLAPEELDSLRKQIREEGCREALTTWNGVIVDGHNRYGICQENGIPFTYTERGFESREQVKAYMIQSQIGRRNLESYQKVELGFKLESIIREMACHNMTAGGGDQKSGFSTLRNPIEPVHTDSEIAKLAGISTGTVYKARVIKNDGTPEQLDRARIGGKGNSINAIYNEIKEKDVEEKQCRRCGETKPKDQFLTGTTLCKECRKETDREREEQQSTPEPEPKPAPIPEPPPTPEKPLSEREQRRERKRTIAAVAADIYDDTRDFSYTIDDLLLDIHNVAETTQRQLSIIIGIHADMLNDETNLKKLTAALSEAEAAIRKTKENLYE